MDSPATGNGQLVLACVGVCASARQVNVKMGKDMHNILPAKHKIAKVFFGNHP